MKVIQVGIGGMGNTWLWAVRESDEVDFAGWVEVDPAIAETQAEEHGLDRSRIFTTLEDALATVQADGVIDVTPPQFHRQVSLLALEAGLPVLSEKPLSNTLEDAQAIVDKANESNTLHMVAQNYRYNVPAQTVKQVLDSGVIGTVGAVTVQFYKGAHFDGFRSSMPYPLIIDMAIHHFDLMRFFLGCDPVAVAGQSWNPPWSWFDGDASAVVTFRFGADIVVNYNGSWCANGRETPWNGNWRFDGEHGVLQLIDDAVSVQRKTGVSGFNNVCTEVQPVPLVEIPRDQQAYLLHEFCEAVTQGKQVATTCQDNIKSLAMVFNTIKAFESGQLIQEGQS